MTEILITILLAVALDLFVPDRHGFKPFAWYRDWAESIEQRFNGGTRVHGIGAVLLATVPLLAAVYVAGYIFGQINPILRIAMPVSSIALFMVAACRLLAFDSSSPPG